MLWSVASPSINECTFRLLLDTSIGDASSSDSWTFYTYIFIRVYIKVGRVAQRTYQLTEIRERRASQSPASTLAHARKRAGVSVLRQHIVCGSHIANTTAV